MPAGVSGLCEIRAHLLLCGINSFDEEAIQKRGVTHVINLTVDIPHTTVPGITCERVALDDKPHAKLSDHFDRCSDKIESVRAAGGCTLVHCVAGVSRSVSLCIAYLMKHEHLSLRDAFDDVKKRRPIARPNIGFFRQLIAYERELFDGVNSVKFVPSPIGAIPDVYLPETKGLLWLEESGDDGEIRDCQTDSVIGDVTKELQELKVSDNYDQTSSKGSRKISSPGDVTPEV